MEQVSCSSLENTPHPLASSPQHRAVDSVFREIMRKTADDPHCLRGGAAPGLVDLFKRNNDTLEGIAKGLEEFLEVGSRRSLYPPYH